MTIPSDSAPTSQASGGPRKAAFLFIFFVVLLDMLAFGIIIPVLPKLVERFMEGNTSEAARIYGYMALGWGLMQFFSMPIIGMLSDRFGRRPVVLISCLGLGLDFILMALAPDLTWLFIGRLLSGLTAASFSTAFAYVADVTPAEERAGKYGLLGAAFGLGFILGPALGGLLGAVEPRLPFWVAAGLSLANVLYGFFVLPESLPAERRSTFSWARANPVGSLRLLRSHPHLMGLGSVMFLMHLAHMVLPATGVLFMSHRFGMTELQTGLTLALVGVSSMIVQAGLVKPMVKRFGESRMLQVGVAFGMTGFLFYGLVPTMTLFLVVVPLMALKDFAGPSLQALMTARVSPTEQGQLQGANSSLMSIAGIIGPVLFTQTFSFFIAPGNSYHLPGAAFLLAGMMMLFALVIASKAAKTPH